MTKATSISVAESGARPGVPGPAGVLPWAIVGMLFLASVLNYIDRQNLSVLARTIQDDLHMSDLHYARIVQAFLLAYTVMYLFAGRITDLLGARVSLAVFVAWWSIANILTAFSRTIFSLGVCRFLLGVGEPGVYTAGPKTVADWMAPKHRGVAIGIYTAGATIGATIAPPLIALLANRYGWRITFVITGCLGLVWIIPWLIIYPAAKPVAAGGLAEPPARTVQSAGQWTKFLAQRETWLLLFARFLTDPVWYFYLFWFPRYLTDVRKLSLLESGKIGWVVYLAADVGAILGGVASGELIRRGARAVPARKWIMIAAACLVPWSALLALVPDLSVALALAGLAGFAHMAWLVTMGALTVDIFPRASLATLFGIIAAGTGLGGMLSQELIGRLVTQFSYTPVFVLMGFAHPIALMLILMVREPCSPHACETNPGQD